MAGETIGTIEGVIMNLDGNYYDLHLALRDDRGRNIVVLYSWSPNGVRERIQEALSVGMKVSVRIEGAVTDSKDYYTGVGIITTLPPKHER